MSSVSGTEREWWKEAVVYEVYPRSFNDSDGDGVGDLPGVAEKLDYLDDLGVDAVWLTPVYDSPLADYGYDVRDYRSILDEYGDMDDWKRVRDGLHDRDIALVMDVVFNHTSDEHEWFRKSRREVEPYADFYVWREGAPDEPPNNWESIFGGSAWTYDEVREAYYLHLFDEKQPDLNWRNPEVRAAVHDVMEWWLERDVDGFRLDVINFVSKPDGLPDGAPAAHATGSEHFIDGPRVLEYLEEMDERVFSNHDVVTIGEMPGVSVADARRYAGLDGPLDMVFHFAHMGLDREGEDPWNYGDWDLADLRETFTRWQEGLYPDGWNALYLANHDQPRSVSRFGDEAHRVESATMLATFLHTLRGTPFVYQGEEVGMTNVPFESPDAFADVETLNYVERMLERPDVEGFSDIAETVRYGSRDNARTPMQWTGATNAGFTSGDSWLTVNPNFTEVNVEAARGDPGSVWHYFRRLVDLRDEHPALVYGRYELLAPDHPAVYAYLRVDDPGDGTGVERGPGDGFGDGDSPERVLVVLNFDDDSAGIELTEHVDWRDADLLIGNYDVDEPVLTDHLELRPYESRVYRLA